MSPAWVLFSAGDITMEGLDKDRQLQTGEIIIIVAVLLMWAGECHKQHSWGRGAQRGWSSGGSRDTLVWVWHPFQ